MNVPNILYVGTSISRWVTADPSSTAAVEEMLTVTHRKRTVRSSASKTKEVCTVLQLIIPRIRLFTSKCDSCLVCFTVVLDGAWKGQN